MQSKEETKIDKMFGFIWNQPIHITLRQMRFVSVSLILVSVDIMYRLLAVIESSKALDSVEGLSAMGVLALGLFTALWKAVDNITAPHKLDG